MRKLLLTVMVSALYLNVPAYAQQENDISSEESMQLRKIMRDMGDDMKLIAGAVSREDWALIVKTSPRIADHPQPPFSEKVRILVFAGTDVSEFKDFDGKTHESARRLGTAAEREDGYAVIDEYSTLQKTCLACHQRFRKSFQEYFYNVD